MTSNLLCLGIQFLPLSPLRVCRRKNQPEPISGITWKNMKMNVEDFLTRSLAIGQEKIYPLALNDTRPKDPSQPLRYTKHLCTLFFFEVAQIVSVPVGNDQHVTGIDRLNIHQRCAVIVPIDHAHCKLA
jgi:hypothetical protein